MSKSVRAELSGWLTEGILTDKSKDISKAHPLEFEEEKFSLKPPKLDSWVLRRAKDKEVSEQVNVSEETLLKIQQKIMDIGQPLIAFFSRIKNLLQSMDPENSESTVHDIEVGLEAT